MNIYEIETFLTVARTLNISKSAEFLNIAQSTVSHRLKSLENYLGFELFHRKRGQKTVKLTNKGELFLSIAQRLNALRKESISIKYKENQFSLHIGYCDSLNTTFTPLFQKIALHSPKINLKISSLSSLQIYELVEKREIDVGFALRELASVNIITEPIFSEPMVVIAMSDDLPKTIHPSELKPESEIFFNWSPTYMAWHNRWWNPMSSHIEVDSVNLIFSIMKDTEYWTIVPKSVAKLFAQISNYRMFELTDPPPNRVCYKITHRYPYANNIQKIEIIDKYLDSII